VALEITKTKGTKSHKEDLTNVQFSMRNSYPKESDSGGETSRPPRVGIGDSEFNIGPIFFVALCVFVVSAIRHK